MHLVLRLADKNRVPRLSLHQAESPPLFVSSRMKLGKFRQSKFGLITAICVMTTVVLINIAGGFAPFNAMFENACHSIGIPRARASSVLMVCASPDLLASGSQDLVNLLDEIHRHSPKAIGLIASAEPRDYQKLDRLTYAPVSYTHLTLPTTPYG